MGYIIILFISIYYCIVFLFLIKFVLQEVRRIRYLYFPHRANITLLVNDPKRFHILYKLLSPLLREITKAKIFLFTNGPKQNEALQQQLCEDSSALLPRTFWCQGYTTATKGVEETSEGGDDRTTSTTTCSSHRHAASVSELEHNLRIFVSVLLSLFVCSFRRNNSP
jgi:CRAL/TRIO domain